MMRHSTGVSFTYSPPHGATVRAPDRKSAWARW